VSFSKLPPDAPLTEHLLKRAHLWYSTTIIQNIIQGMMLSFYTGDHQLFSIMKKGVLYCICLILVMLVTGVFWGTWFTLTRSLDQFPPDNFIRIGKTIIANVAWPMRILMPLTLVMLLWLSWTSFRKRPSFYFFLGSLILMVISLLITVGVEVPIDNQIKTWTTETLPDNWTELRLRWNKFHTLRTVTSLMSFISLSIGVTGDVGKNEDVLKY
jgi:uncharacterized membrane protein